MLHPNVILFKVLKLLQERQIPMSEAEILSELQIGQRDFENVRDILQANARISSVDGIFQFRPLVIIRSEADIKAHFDANRDSVVKSEDIQSASLANSLQSCTDASHDFLCIETKGSGYKLYYNDLKSKRLTSDLLALWQSTS